MFYDTRTNDHGLPRDPFKAIVSPRTVGWITSMSAKGEINLAPYSFFNAVSDRPPIVLFSSEGRKDSLAFVEETKEFVCNLAVLDLFDAVVTTFGAAAARCSISLRARMQALANRRTQRPRWPGNPPPRRVRAGDRRSHR
jgi:flavin reductase (DIM6/NTAB) family NADH-FMN oxidoreductase RutF